MILITQSPRGYATVSCSCGWFVDSFFGPTLAARAEVHRSHCSAADAA